MYYTDIKTKDQLVSELEKFIGEKVSFYYICEHCDDDQMTERMFITEEILGQIEEYGKIFTDMYCTHCDGRIKYLPTDYVTGLEVD